MYRDIAAKKIPIRNIYYMLSYAWEQLKTDESKDVDSVEFDNIYNLLTKIYIQGLKSIIKRGIYKDYIEESSELCTLKGKVNIKKSINKLSFLKNKMVCEYDNFSIDNNLNRIVKATIDLLIRNEAVDKDYKKELKLHSFYFENIPIIDISIDSFSRLKYNKNNIHYKLLIDISKLIYEGLLATEENGQVKFLNFIRDKQLADLYEKFVLNFYKKKLSRRYRVHSPIINWDATSNIGEDLKYLPIMKTDIVVEDKIEDIQIIIDTKFYSNTLMKSQHQSNGKINSNNLYQIYSYINNSDFYGQIKGILLYPQIYEKIDVDYIIRDKKISIKTVNLDDDWVNIEERLIALIEKI